jgi:hypothetical protein
MSAFPKVFVKCGRFLVCVNELCVDCCFYYGLDFIDWSGTRYTRKIDCRRYSYVKHVIKNETGDTITEEGVLRSLDIPPNYTESEKLEFMALRKTLKREWDKVLRRPISEKTKAFERRWAEEKRKMTAENSRRLGEIDAELEADAMESDEYYIDWV